MDADLNGDMAKSRKKLALVALHCLVFNEWVFSQGFLNQFVHREFRSCSAVRQTRKGSLKNGFARQPRPCELLNKISWISKTR